MARTQRILAATAVGAVVLVAARPAADLVRSLPEENLAAVPAVSPVERPGTDRISRDELERRELDAQAIATGAEARSASLSSQAKSIAKSEKALQKKAEAKRKADAKRAAEAKRKAEAERKAAATREAKAARERQQKSSSSGSGKSGSSGSSGGGSTPTGSPQAIAKKMMQSDYGWGASEFTCYDNIIMRESNWDPRADNPTSDAYGIPQALPGSKMASAGADWRTNPATQIKWSLGYIDDRYGTPCQAWSFKSANGWY